MFGTVVLWIVDVRDSCRVDCRQDGSARAGGRRATPGRDPRRLQTLHCREAATPAGALGEDPHEGDRPAHHQHPARREGALHQARLARRPAASLPRDVRRR